jgi:hypothetical protein
MLLKPRFLAVAAAFSISACSDGLDSDSRRALAPTAPTDENLVARSSEKYVAIGTSISMGWASNGVYGVTQALSWPELLAFGSGRPITLPLIQSPGCISPLIAPLGAGKRLSGESASGSTTCAPLVAGVTLPTQNVALAGAIAADAVQKTPETASPTAPWYSRVLPPGMTQLTATLSQSPTIVSVELGGNEVLGATSGLFMPGVTVVPFPFFAQPYNALLDALSASQVKAVLVGLPSDARSLPAMRRGDEIWANRAEFAALHVDVSSDCDGSQNWINVSLKSLTMVYTGAFTSSNGLPNPVFSCADIPGTPDQVLTPSDIAAANALLAQMTAHIKQQATARGFAYFSLGALFDRSDIKGGAYSVVKQMTSNFPYGLYTSLDGVHPNAIGHALLAFNAARAINTTYGNAGRNSIARVEAGEPSLADRLEEPMLPSLALTEARRVALNNRHVRLAACWIPGGCGLERLAASRR